MSMEWRGSKRATKIVFVFQEIIGFNAQIVGDFLCVASVQIGFGPGVAVVICPLQEFLTLIQLGWKRGGDLLWLLLLGVGMVTRRHWNLLCSERG